VGWKTHLNPRSTSVRVQGKTLTKGDSSRQSVAPVSSRQFSKQGRQFDLASDPLEGTSKSFLQQVSSKFSDQD